MLPHTGLFWTCNTMKTGYVGTAVAHQEVELGMCVEMGRFINNNARENVGFIYIE